MGARQLVSQIRTVPEEARSRYDSGWEEVRREATALGAHAWRFHSTIHPERYLEFLEFAANGDPREEATVAAPLLALDRDFGTAEVEEWEELQ
ncbi:MAG: hypothetical protein KY464_03060 [Gemmatimonadetes bacterium]|nr:hypothetical protein [Gemmatimonadota bacterium]